MVVNMTTKDLGKLLDPIDANIASFWYAGMDYPTILLKFVRPAIHAGLGSRAMSGFWRPLKDAKAELKQLILSEYPRFSKADLTTSQHIWLYKTNIVQCYIEPGPREHLSVQALRAIYGTTEKRNVPLATKQMECESLNKFRVLVSTPAPAPKIFGVDREDFYLHVSAGTCDGHVSLAGSAAEEIPRSDGGRALHFFNWAKSQSMRLPKTLEEASQSPLWGMDVAQSYVKYCFKKMKTAIRKGKPIPMRAHSVCELGKARVITMLPGYAVQGLIALQKLLLGCLENIPEVKDGVFFRDDGYRAYATIDDKIEGFITADLVTATDNPSRLLAGEILDLIVRFAKRSEAQGWGVIIDDEVVEMIKVAKQFLAIDRLISLPSGEKFIAKRAIFMGDPLTKIVLTLSVYVTLKETFPGRWFRVKGDNILLSSPKSSRVNDMSIFKQRLAETGYPVSEVDTYWSTVAEYCEVLFKVPRRRRNKEFVARQNRRDYALADPPKGRMFVPFWKSQRGQDKSMTLPETKIGQLAKQADYFEPGSPDWRLFASAIVTAVKSFRLEKDILLNVPQSHAGLGVDPEIFGARSNIYYWTQFSHLKMTNVGHKQPTVVCPDIPRFVRRRTNHAFSHKYRLEPSQLIPKEWSKYAIDLGKFSEFPIELSSILERSPAYSSEATVASYCQSVQSFLEKFCDAEPRKLDDPEKGFLKRIRKLNSYDVPDEVRHFVDRYKGPRKIISKIVYPAELIPQRLVWREPARRIIRDVPKTPDEMISSLEQGIYPDIDLINQAFTAFGDDGAGTIVVSTKDRALCKYIYKVCKTKFCKPICVIQMDTLRFDTFDSEEEIFSFLQARYRVACTDNSRGHNASISYRVFGTPSMPVSSLTDSGFLEKEGTFLKFTLDGNLVNCRDLGSCTGQHDGIA
jgi:hypothetical protein